MGLIPVQCPEADLLWDSLMFRVLGRDFAGGGPAHPRTGRAMRRRKIIPARVCWHEDATYANREKKTSGTYFLRILSLYGDLIWELSGACSRRAPPLAPTTPRDPIHLILDPKRPGERVSGVSLAVGALLGGPRARFLRINYACHPLKRRTLYYKIYNDFPPYFS